LNKGQFFKDIRCLDDTEQLANIWQLQTHIIQFNILSNFIEYIFVLDCSIESSSKYGYVAELSKVAFCSMSSSFFCLAARAFSSKEYYGMKALLAFSWVVLSLLAIGNYY